jgi:hypothetical protein
MYAGSSQAFGELALLHADKKRNATIIADEDADLLVISHSLFNNTIKVNSRHLSQSV